MTSTISLRRAKARRTRFTTLNWPFSTRAGSTPLLITGHRCSSTLGHKKAGVVRRRPSCRLLIQNLSAATRESGRSRRSEALRLCGRLAMCPDRRDFTFGCAAHVFVLGNKLLLGAMQKHTQIFPAHAKFPTNFVLVSLLKEDRPQDISVLGWKLCQYAPYLQFGFFRQQHAVGRGRLVGGITRQVPQRLCPRSGAIRFPQYVVADRTYKSAKALRLPDTAFRAHRRPCSQQCFLLHIFYMLRTHQPAAQFVVQDFAEICDKMGFSGYIQCPELMQVGFIELMEIQIVSSSHFPLLLPALFPLESRCKANGFTRRHSGCSPNACPARHIDECLPLLVS